VEGALSAGRGRTRSQKLMELSLRIVENAGKEANRLNQNAVEREMPRLDPPTEPSLGCATDMPNSQSRMARRRPGSRGRATLIDSYS